jgi:conjugative transfer signal peptidase TraF
MSRPSRLRVITVACLGCLLVVGARRDAHAPRVVLNTTASAPLGLYVISPGRFGRGQLAAVSPPPGLARWMAIRGYLPANVPLLKEVAASGGQQVCGRDRRIFIDGVRVAEARHRDRWGRDLPAFEGCRRLGPAEVFLLNRAAPHSLDSRYFGPVPADRVIGGATPVWIWGGDR